MYAQSIKTSPPQKKSIKIHFYFVPMPNHFKFLDLSKDAALQIKTLI